MSIRISSTHLCWIMYVCVCVFVSCMYDTKVFKTYRYWLYMPISGIIVHIYTFEINIHRIPIYRMDILSIVIMTDHDDNKWWWWWSNQIGQKLYVWMFKSLSLSLTLFAASLFSIVKIKNWKEEENNQNERKNCHDQFRLSFLIDNGKFNVFLSSFFFLLFEIKHHLQWWL